MTTRIFPKLLERVVAALALSAVAMGCGDGSQDREEAGLYPSIDELPRCSPDAPSFECLKRLFLPLRRTEWPFDRQAVDSAYRYQQGAGTQVAVGFGLTALHVLDGNISSTGVIADCYAAEFEYAAPGERIERERCGSFLFLGGHPQSAACEAAGESLLECVDRVPVSEAFDIGLVAEAARGTLDVRTDVEVGERVFIVGNPSFLFFIDGDEASWFSELYPLVSSGRVLALDGRGMVISNLAYPGNSGGPVLDAQGRIVGVAYTKIHDLRAFSTPTDPALADHRTVAVRIDERMKARIEEARAGF